MALILKIIVWIKMNFASVFGAVQALVKAAKELVTAVINLLSLIIPTMAAEKLIIKIRSIFEAIDAFLEKIKGQLIPII